MATRNQDQNPETMKPGTSHETSNSMSALMTRTNRPSVRIDNGNVRITNTGLRNVLTTPNIRPATNSDCAVVNIMPSNRSSATHRDSVFTPQKISKRRTGLVVIGGIVTKKDSALSA